jgi:hypothetical protein
MKDWQQDFNYLQEYFICTDQTTNLKYFLQIGNASVLMTNCARSQVNVLILWS